MSTKKITDENALLAELFNLIEQSQHQAASHFNSTLTILFWQIGSRINEQILKHKRAEYAKRIVSTVSTQLTAPIEEIHPKIYITHRPHLSKTFRNFIV